MVIAEKNAIEVYSNINGLDPCLDLIKKAVSDFEPDLSTGTSRAKIASLANNVAKTKVFLDNFGKDLVIGWKAKSKKVDESRRKVRDELDALKIIARKPLTDWELEEIDKANKLAEKEAAEKLAAQVENDHEMGLLMNDEFDRIAEAKKTAELKAEQERQETLKREQKARDDRIAEEAREKLQREHDARLEAEREQIRVEEEAKAKEKIAKLKLKRASRIKRWENSVAMAENEKTLSGFEDILKFINDPLFPCDKELFDDEYETAIDIYSESVVRVERLKQIFQAEEAGRIQKKAADNRQAEVKKYPLASCVTGDDFDDVEDDLQFTDDKQGYTHIDPDNPQPEEENHPETMQAILVEVYSDWWKDNHHKLNTYTIEEFAQGAFVFGVKWVTTDE